MKIFRKKTCAAFTLAEMMMSVGCGSLILAAVVSAGVAMQRSFAAVEGYSLAEGDQLRVLDYIAMDSRRATAASVSGNVLSLTLPVYYNAGNSNTPYPPTLTSGALSYGSGSVTISYQQSGSNFTRSVTVNGGATTTSTIAKNVSTFTVTPVDQGGTNGTVTCSITFSPTFTHLVGPGPVAGTTVYINTFLRNASARH
jgi:Tfp pilus assembly protein PilW